MKIKLRSMLSLLTALILIGVCTGCASTQDTSSAPAQDGSSQTSPAEVESPAPAADKPIVIGLSQPSLGWPYIAAFVKEFEPLVAATPGVEAIILSADGSIEKQINDINDLIVQQVDVLLVCSLDGEAVIPALAQAHEAGIPVLAVSNEPGAGGKQYLKGYSGPDDYEQGCIAARIMVDAIGTEGNIVMIEGSAGQSTTLLRAQGWNDTMAEIAPDMVLLASQPCDWDAAKEKAAMQAFITKYGDEIDGVFAQGSGAAVGEVVRDAGLEIPVICTGCKTDTLEAIREGHVYGTMQQSPYIDASQAIELAMKIAKGEDLPSDRVIIPMPIVTSENCWDVEADF